MVGTAETVDVTASAPPGLVTQHRGIFDLPDAVFLMFICLTRQDAMSLANLDFGAMPMAAEEEKSILLRTYPAVVAVVGPERKKTDGDAIACS